MGEGGCRERVRLSKEIAGREDGESFVQANA